MTDRDHQMTLKTHNKTCHKLSIETQAEKIDELAMKLKKTLLRKMCTTEQLKKSI